MKLFLSIVAAVVALAAGVFGAAKLLEQFPNLTNSINQAISPPSSSSSESSSKASEVEIGLIKDEEPPKDIDQALDLAIGANKDALGWLTLPDTNISNAVVQSINNDYYLRLNERKQSDPYGCYFLDYECSADTRNNLSRNSVIYGHSDITGTQDNPEGRRFSQLFKLTDPEFAKTHPYLYFWLPGERMTWKIFAVLYTPVDSDYITVKMDDAEQSGLIQKAKSASIYDYDVEVTPQDKILTLSTCSIKDGKNKPLRFIVMAKLMPEEYRETEQASIK